MSTNLVIVAIPEENDRVWKVSSEQVPHLTLLFLGEADNNPHLAQIVQFVQHATELSEHGQFYLDVDHRGTLGDAEADVLYFNKRSWNLKWIKQFRGQLLQNQQIRSAYDAVPQHTAPQDWVPHLTLGYPDTPAKSLKTDGDFDHPLYSVCFDRIAVWTEEFDGPEFRLEWPEREEMDGPLSIAYSESKKAALLHYARNGMEDQMSGTAVAERGQESESTIDHGEAFVEALIHSASGDVAAEQFMLEHWGIKGMRWGFRRSPPEAVTPTVKSVVPHGSRRKTKIEREGGENHPATTEALQVEKSRAKLKKSGPKALTNNELRDIAERLRLEEQAVQADRSTSHKWIRRFLGNQGNQAANQVVRTEVDSVIRGRKNK